MRGCSVKTSKDLGTKFHVRPSRALPRGKSPRGAPLLQLCSGTSKAIRPPLVRILLGELYAFSCAWGMPVLQDGAVAPPGVHRWKYISSIKKPILNMVGDIIVSHFFFFLLLLLLFLCRFQCSELFFFLFVFSFSSSSSQSSVLNS